MDRQEVLADDVQPRGRQQMVDVGDAAGDRVLDRDHGELGLALVHRREGILEGRAGQRLPIGIDLRQAMWEFAPGSPWNDDGLGGHGRSVASGAMIERGRPLQVLGGVDAERHVVDEDASMRMPASSARSCSSLSRFSRGDGGRPTKRCSAARR